MATSTHSRAGIHLDGTRGCVAIVHGHGIPSVELLQSVSGVDTPSTLAAAAALLPADMPVRVTSTGLGFEYAAVEVTSTELTRRGYTRAARAVLGHASGTVAGTLGDLDDVSNGRPTSGLACSAPPDLVDAVYAALGSRPGAVEVVATAHASWGQAVTLGEGPHLYLRMHSTEIVWITEGGVRAARVLRAGGTETVTAALGQDASRARTALAGGAADPLAAAAVTRWADAICEELAELIEQDILTGGPANTEVVCHGPGAATRYLPTALDKRGLRFAAAAAPRRGVDPALGEDAYTAAATYGENMPYVGFIDSRRVIEVRRDQRAARATARRRTLAAAAVAAVVAILGPLAVTETLAFLGDRQVETAREELARTPKGVAIIATEQLRSVDTAAGTSTSVLADLTALAADANVQVDDLQLRSAGPVTDPGARATLTADVTGGSDDLEPFLAALSAAVAARRDVRATVDVDQRPATDSTATDSTATASLRLSWVVDIAAPRLQGTTADGPSSSSDAGAPVGGARASSARVDSQGSGGSGGVGGSR